MSIRYKLRWGCFSDIILELDEIRQHRGDGVSWENKNSDVATSKENVSQNMAPSHTMTSEAPPNPESPLPPVAKARNRFSVEKSSKNQSESRLSLIKDMR